ncbi:DNA-binding protein [Streptomyces antnestii]|uniref:DNA-binding protein n=1 Tax=Streptomyces antnestii TaxID=2494256 RepID=A0A3S2Z553_9ACTN|nr:helix-turn-helix domain-containing protein [Streptomyces sp. San01]RVU29010.1 DNA-binding protein [Streptomyces sp. San01]
MTSESVEESAQSDRTDVDLTYLLALPPGEAPASSDRSTPPIGTPPRPQGRTTARPGRSRRGSQTSQPGRIAKSAPADAGVDVNDEEALRLFTAEQAAGLLQVPPSWLRKKAAAGAIPHTRIGRHLRFSAHDLHRLIATGQCGPTDARHG